MTDYKIERWDVVIYNNNNIKIPVIQIKPDEKLLNFAKNNHNVLKCYIKGVDNIYNSKTIPGILSPCLQSLSFCPKQGYYIIKLYSRWYGYPSKLGFVSFPDM